MSDSCSLVAMGMLNCPLVVLVPTPLFLRKKQFKGVGHRVQHHHPVLKNTSLQHLIIQEIDMNSVVPP